MANLIHFSEIKIQILDRSVANFDEVWKRTKGPLPVSATVTMWGQVQTAKQQEREPIAQGDAERTDGYVYFEKPLATTPSKGDFIIEVDGRGFKAKIIEVRDETVYYMGAEWTRVDYLRIWDAA